MTPATRKIRVDMATMSLGQMADASDLWDEYPKNKGRTFNAALEAGDFRAIAHAVAVAGGLTVEEVLAMPADAIEVVGKDSPEGRRGGSGVKRSPSRANGA